MALSRLKVAVNGDVFFDDEPVTLGDLAALLERVKESDGVVVYYRERVMLEDPPARTRDVLQKLVDAKVKIALGDKVAPPHGHVRHLMLYQGDNTFTMLLSPDGYLQMSIPREAQEPVALNVPVDEEHPFREQLAIFAEADRVLDTPLNEPNAQLSDYGGVPCTYVAIGFADERTWVSYFPGDSAPENIKNFARDCEDLIMRAPSIQEVVTGG